MSKRSISKQLYNVVLVSIILFGFRGNAAFALQTCTVAGKSVDTSNGAVRKTLNGIAVCQEDGVKLREEEFKSGKLVKMRQYHDNGKLKYQESYDGNGKRDGVASTYYKSGKLESEISNVGGGQKGKFRKFYENGTLESKGHYAESNDVTKLAFNEDGSLKEIKCGSGSFDAKDRELCGYTGGAHRVVVYASKSRPLREHTFEQGKMIQTRMFDSSGKMSKSMEVATKSKDGIQVENYPNGKTKLEKRYNSDDQLNGIQSEYAESGQKTREAIFDKGFMTKETVYYLNGQTKRLSLRKQDGRKAIVQAQEFWDNGKLQLSGTYEETTRTNSFDYGYFWRWDEMLEQGLVKTWREDGTLSSEDNYRDGKREGVSRTFYDDGKKVAQENTYKDDNLTREKTYDETGKLLTHVEYFADGSKRQYKVGK